MTYTNVKVPALLLIPPKLLPVIIETDKFNYFLLEGGRGGGKSQTIARFLLYVGGLGRLRIVCGREIQNTIDESVYALLVDLINTYRLDYEVQTNKLIHRKTVTEFIFKGFREQGKVNIKGLEGANVLWVDEAQAIKAETLKIIIPTIRKEKSKVFWTMNRYLEDDPVYAEFAGRDDCLHIHVDFHENPYCTKRLLEEAHRCKGRHPDDYPHIWLGVPRKTAKNAAFYNVDSIVDLNLPIEQEPKPGFHYSLGSDLAKRVTHTSITIICIESRQVVYHRRYESGAELSWNYLRETVYALGKKYNDAIVNPDSTGVGDPITEDLQRMGANVFVEQMEKKENPKEIAGFKFSSLSKENLMEKLKVAIELQLFKIPDIASLIKSLKRYLKIIQANGRVKYAMPDEKDEEGNPIYTEDEVISIALALWGTRTMIYDPAWKPKEKPTFNQLFWGQVKREVVQKTILENSGQGMGESGIISPDDATIISEDDIIDV